MKKYQRMPDIQQVDKHCCECGGNADIPKPYINPNPQTGGYWTNQRYYPDSDGKMLCLDCWDRIRDRSDDHVSLEDQGDEQLKKIGLERGPAESKHAHAVRCKAYLMENHSGYARLISKKGAA